MSAGLEYKRVPLGMLSQDVPYWPPGNSKNAEGARSADRTTPALSAEDGYPTASHVLTQ